MNVTPIHLFDAAEATWPEARRWQVGPFTLRDGQGGGQRVSAATAEDAFTVKDISAAEDAMRSGGQQPLFQVRNETCGQQDGDLCALEREACRCRLCRAA